MHLEFRVMAKLLSLGITSSGAHGELASWRGDAQCTCAGRLETAACRISVGTARSQQFGRAKKKKGVGGRKMLDVLLPWCCAIIQTREPER